jgi:hypothetical protein
MHPKSGEAHTWRAGKLNPDGYYVRKWWEGDRRDRKLREQLEHRWLWEGWYGPIPAGYIVHHRDHNPRNNARANLELQTRAAHSRYHGDELRRRGIRPPRAARTAHRTVDGQDERRCSTCHVWQPLSAYSGASYQCRPCISAANRATYRRRHPEARRNHSKYQPEIPYDTPGYKEA